MKQRSLKDALYSMKWSFKRIWALFRNEIEALLKDKQSLMIVFLLPLAILIPFYEPPGAESSGNLEDLISFSSDHALGILDLDDSEGWSGEDLSENFTSIFEVNTSYDVVHLTDANEGKQKLENGEIIAFIEIPYGFEENISLHLTTRITLVIDATDVENAASLTATLEIAIVIFKITHGLLRDEIYPISFQAFRSNSPLFDSGPIIFAIMIFGAALLLTCQSIVGDEPLKRTLLTPAGKLEVIVGKTLAYSAIHAIQVQSMLFVSMTIFRLPVYCPFIVAFLLLFLLAFSGIMIGMFLSMVSKSRLQANQLFLLVFIISLLSLIFISDPVITDWLPVYQGVDGFTTVAFKGFGFKDAPWSFISFGVISVIFLALTIITFYYKKTIE
ncbi:MAG: ABC transporter permease [Promethearchaeota archaeon]